MRISKQISGNRAKREEGASQGRGEYEWCDLQPNDPHKDALENRRILIRFPEAVILDTACEFDIQGGKSRLRVAGNARSDRSIYPMYHIATALLLPCPTRFERNMERGLPVLRTKAYIMTDMIAGEILLPTDTDADVEIVTVRVANHTVPDGEDIDLAGRFAQVQQVWANRVKLPKEIAGLIEEHEQLVRSGDQISIVGLKLLKLIQSKTAEASCDLDVAWCTPSTDPLSTLLDMIGVPHPEMLPTPIEEIPPELLEVRRREIARQRRLAAARGSQGARFRRDVRDAYRSTCVICGLSLPRLWEGGKAGVDSAHILPDSEFDLNHISNGLCLCKLHHWAFDEGLIELRHEQAAGYYVVIPDEVKTQAAGPPARIDLDFLQPHLGPVPVGRLPAKRANWPSPECLKRLRELLYP